MSFLSARESPLTTLVPFKQVSKQRYSFAMSDEQAILSHEETWDDSALIESWNEALAEYKVSDELLLIPQRETI